MALLTVKDLRVSFFTPAGEVKAVGGVSYTLNNHEVLGIVGESGSGKSVSAYSLMGLLQSPGRVVGGSVDFDGEDLLGYTSAQMRQFRGNRVSMIFQNPMVCLNPVYTIGNQLMEALLCHSKVTRTQARDRAAELLKKVGISNALKRMSQYPHELSGGMRQRVMIAMALICNPALLIADEPTTALDVTIQAQILDLMKELQKETGMAILFITHNLGVVADICDRVAVMYAGHIVEMGTADEIFYKPKHPYTIGLLRSLPRLDEVGHERLIPIKGTPVDMLNPPEGCPLSPRCDQCMNICLRAYPAESRQSDTHSVSCWLHHKDAHAAPESMPTPLSGGRLEKGGGANA